MDRCARALFRESQGSGPGEDAGDETSPRQRDTKVLEDTQHTWLFSGRLQLEKLLPIERVTHSKGRREGKSRVKGQLSQKTKNQRRTGSHKASYVKKNKKQMFLQKPMLISRDSSIVSTPRRIEARRGGGKVKVAAAKTEV